MHTASSTRVVVDASHRRKFESIVRLMKITGIGQKEAHNLVVADLAEPELLGLAELAGEICGESKAIGNGL
jgi:hypothetical protein